MKKLFIIIILLVGSFSFAQEKPELVDKFGKITSSDLNARVDAFRVVLDKNQDSIGYIILRGPIWGKYLNNRRIQGCNRTRKYPLNDLKFVYAETRLSTDVEFWRVPKGYQSSKFVESTPDYRLDLVNPTELSVSGSFDNECPIWFDLDYYATFMIANPTYTGKVIIDSTKNDFLKRVVRYRKKLADLGVAPSRIRYFRHHFPHERDEKWLLVPPKRK